jgi:methylsterol monooxygenase
MVALYYNPTETIVVGVGTLSGPFILATLFPGSTHVVLMLSWVGIRLWQAIDAHCGYDFPWGLQNWLPFYAGPEHHEYHHQGFVGNYGSFFRFWDWAMSTDAQYKQAKAMKVVKVE